MKKKTVKKMFEMMNHNRKLGISATLITTAWKKYKNQKPYTAAIEGFKKDEHNLLHEYKVPLEDIMVNVVDGPMNPYKTYGKTKSGHKAAKKPVRGSASKVKRGK